MFKKMKILIKFFITFSIFSNNDAVPIKIKTSRIAGTTTHANTLNHLKHLAKIKQYKKQ